VNLNKSLADELSQPTSFPTARSNNTRKPSCRWQTRTMLAKSLHGLHKEEWVVSCIASLPFDSVPMVSYYVLYSNCVCKMHRFGDTRLLKLPWPWNMGEGHSRSSKLTPFNSLHMVSYYHPIVTSCLKCTFLEIWRHIGRKSPKKPNPSSFGMFLWVDPLRVFRWIIPCQKLEWWGYQMVYISRSCFYSARHYTGVWRTDVKTDGETRRCCKDLH